MIKGWRKKHSKKSHHHHQSHLNNEHDQFCQMTDTERLSEYLRLAEEGWNHAWEIYHHDDWKLSTGKDLQGGCVYTRHDSDGRKIFKLDGLIDAEPIHVFNQLVHGDNESPAWNPTVLLCKTVEKLNDNTDIAYNVASPGAGGMVSSRDFVNLRHWKTEGELTLSLGLSTCHPEMPPTNKYVRAENKPAAWVFKPQDNGRKCHFTLILKTDLKGWLPHYLVDQAMTGCLVNYIKFLRDRMSDLKQQQQQNGTISNNVTTTVPNPTEKNYLTATTATNQSETKTETHLGFKSKPLQNGYNRLIDSNGGELSRSESESSFQSCDEDDQCENADFDVENNRKNETKIATKLEELDLNGQLVNG